MVLRGHGLGLEHGRRVLGRSHFSRSGPEALLLGYGHGQVPARRDLGMRMGLCMNLGANPSKMAGPTWTSVGPSLVPDFGSLARVKSRRLDFVIVLRA